MFVQEAETTPPLLTMEPLLIVGMYKSGTSWLLACLSAHRQCLGFREVDLIKAVGGFRRLMRIKRTFQLHDPATRIQTLFGKSAWCHLPASFYRDLLAEPNHAGQTLADLSPGVVIDRISRHFTEADKTVQQIPPFSTPRSFLFFDQARLKRLYTALRQTSNADGFLNTVFALTEEEIAAQGLTDLCYYCFKGADQLSVIDALDDVRRPIKKLIIIRDGRDAAISAVKFSSLMRQRQAAWTDAAARLGYFDYLKSWAYNIAQVRKRMKDDAYYVLRYEDLNLHFHDTFSQLLRWLGLDAPPGLIEAIHNQTSFETVTGRKRGEEMEAVIRKGAVKEWAEVLSEDDKKQAWKIAGKHLRAFGYPER